MGDSSTAIDPVCGMTVDRTTALNAEVEGRTYYFCAAGCRKAFLADPGSYLHTEHQHGSHEHHGHDH